jgi:hypothetical protein
MNETTHWKWIYDEIERGCCVMIESFDEPSQKQTYNDVEVGHHGDG